MWDLETIFVVYEKNTYNLQELLDAKEAEGEPTNNAEFNKTRRDQNFEDVVSKSKLARIVPIDMLTYFGFIESTDVGLCDRTSLVPKLRRAAGRVRKGEREPFVG